MIKIEISDTVKVEIEEFHWKWSFFRFKKKFNGSAIKEIRKLKTALKLRNLKELKQILIGDSDTIQQFIYRIGKIDKESTNYGDLINYFGYDNFQKGNYQEDVFWNAYELCKKLKVNVCPYCNREYTFTIGNTKEKRVRPEIDHFFPKSEYPYLSCSLYNMIPSCHICNHGKREFGEGILHPYSNGFDKDIIFGAKFHSVIPEKSNLLDASNTQIFFKTKGCKLFDSPQNICSNCLKARKSIKTFHLEEIYNEHKIELQDLFTRYRNYSKPKIYEITKLIINGRINLDDLGLNEKQKNDLYQKIASTYTKRIKRTILGLPLGAGDKQYPLRKFKEDIIEQLDNTARKMKTEARNKNISK